MTVKELQNKRDLELIEEIVNRDYVPGDLIFPHEIAARLSMKKLEVYNIMLILERKRVVQKIYQAACPECKNMHIRETINDVSLHERCEKCGNMYNGLDNCYVLFRKLREI